MHASACLHRRLEGGNILGAGDESSNLGGRGIALGEVVGQVAFDAAWVEAVAVGTWVLRYCSVSKRRQWTKKLLASSD